MAIGNIARKVVSDSIKKRMGDYSPAAMALAQDPVSKYTNKLDKYENKLLSKIPGSRQLLGTVRFGGGMFGGFQFPANPRLVGMISSDGSQDLPDQYKVRITSSFLNTTVVAYLQDQTSFRITSEWEPFLPMAVSGVANQLSQLVTGHSLVSRFMTRRIWKGTSPVEISLTLQFRALTSAYTDVVQPVKSLMQMALPSSADPITIGRFKLPFLSPPGPDPYSGEAVNQQALASVSDSDRQTIQSIVRETKAGDLISIHIGTFLQFHSVIVREVNPVFDQMMDEHGNPLSASVTMVFETYEILTKEQVDGTSGSPGIFIRK